MTRTIRLTSTSYDRLWEIRIPDLANEGDPFAPLLREALKGATRRKVGRTGATYVLSVSDILVEEIQDYLQGTAEVYESDTSSHPEARQYRLDADRLLGVLKGGN